MSRGMALRYAGAVIGGLIAAWLMREGLATGYWLLVAIGLGFVSFAAIAGWQAGALAELIAGLRSQTGPARPAGPLVAPELSKSRAAKVRQIIAALAAEQVFAPEVPEPKALFGPIADRDELPDQEVVLTALWEAEYYAPGFDPRRHMARLAFHDSKAEQGTETVAGQLADLARLCGDDLPITKVQIDHPLVDGPGPQPRCTIVFDAAGSRIELSYRPASKYLSTVPHVAVARALVARGTGQRLAWLWNDQGAWLCGLTAGGAERLNAAAGKVRGGFGGWEWIDLAQPHAAGDD